MPGTDRTNKKPPYRAAQEQDANITENGPPRPKSERAKTPQASANSGYVGGDPVQNRGDVDPVVQRGDPATNLTRIAQTVPSRVNREDGICKVASVWEDG